MHDRFQLPVYTQAGHAFLIQHATSFAAAVRRFLVDPRGCGARLRNGPKCSRRAASRSTPH
jgi:hypothetical protein